MNSKKVSLLFAGDFCSRPSASVIEVDNRLETIVKGADYAIVNFETPLKPATVNQINGKLFQHEDSVTLLKIMGFSLFNICNNHILDYGSNGVIETINKIGKDNVMGFSNEDNSIIPYYKEISGVRFAFIPLCYDCYSTDFRNEYSVNAITSNRIYWAIEKAKEHSDYIIIIPHDGIEYIPIPTPYIRDLYKSFVDMGAHAVIATHPHSIQGMEYYKNAPIFYSLGNFFFNSKATVDFKTPLPGWYDGMLVKLTFFDGIIEVENYYTKNENNRRLLLDSNESKDAEFKELCNLLNDDKKYFSLLNEIMLNKLQNKYLPVLNNLFRMQIQSKGGFIYLLKQIALSLQKKRYTGDSIKLMLMQEAEKRVLIDSLDLMK